MSVLVHIIEFIQDFIEKIPYKGNQCVQCPLHIIRHIVKIRKTLTQEPIGRIIDCFSIFLEVMLLLIISLLFLASLNDAQGLPLLLYVDVQEFPYKQFLQDPWM